MSEPENLGQPHFKLKITLRLNQLTPTSSILSYASYYADQENQSEGEGVRKPLESHIMANLIVC